MPCFHPLKAIRQPGGGVQVVKRNTWAPDPLELPCGQCVGCRIERSQQWAARCVHEASLHERNSFITLTYDPEHLPQNGSLDVRHWQLFAKKLRKRVGSFRFFHCGEYGEEHGRPHYHAIIFGEDFGADKYLHSVSKDRTGKEHKLFRSPTLEECWEKGFSTIGNVSYESCAYVARYVMKKKTGPEAKEEYERVDEKTGEVFQVKPPYITMSRRPNGIGHEWLKKYKSDVYPYDEVIIDGRRHRPPRYYDNQLEEEELEEYKEKRRKKVVLRKKELTPERLDAREKVLNRRLKILERKL